MLAGGRGLAPMFLCFLCLIALTRQEEEQHCLRDTLNLVKLFIHTLPSELSESSLYTPTIADYQICPKATMSCFAEEMKVLFHEWNTVKGVKRGSKLIGVLDDLAAERTQTNSACPECERHGVKNATEFLTSLRETLQLMNNEPGRC